MTRRIAVVTGTRADYGLLQRTLTEIQATLGLSLRLMVTGAHLEARFGETWQAIVADGFTIDDRIPLGLSADCPVDIAAAMARGLVGFVEAFSRSPVDLVVLLGDRYEAMVAAQAAMVCRLPIAHIHGGERTEGLIDEAIRHSITKMAHLHFTTAEPYRRRVIQLGEAPDRVFNVGAPGVDSILDLDLPGVDALSQHLGLDLSGGYFLVTYHPLTLDGRPSDQPVYELIAALDRFPQYKVVMTGVNADPGNRPIAAVLDRYAADHPDRVRLIANLGQRRYLGAMKHCLAVVGNSSSGLIEAPSFPVATVNIGDRQNGRLRVASIIDCVDGRDAIASAITKVISPSFSAVLAQVVPPYGQGGAAHAIVNILRTFPLETILFKAFHDVEFNA
jgi:UDP-hydrolysing UDP-N-acetyl-D-glucosamine 2-epimerase